MTRHIFPLLLALGLAGAVWAMPNEENDYTRLARLSYLEGHVSYQHATDVDWAAASINLPLEPGDRIYTSSDGRAEIEFDDGSIYRLARNTDVEILSLKEDLIQLRVLVGLSTLIVSSDTNFEIDTPAAALNALRDGVYRFEVDDNGDSNAIVRKGRLEAANNSFSRYVESGEVLHIALSDDGNPDYARYETRDEWDEWNDRRDADLNAYDANEYLPDNVSIGVSDLYQYGRWEDVDSYGWAWIPTSVDAGWSPYSIGRWCYRPRYGWTWVSYEPWGWLPYHYGRWYRSSLHGWCWIPGPAFSFNFWSPGLVAFYSGPGWISWCPLGPGDYYNVNYYHFKRGIYGYQLSQLLNMQTRAPGNLLYRDVPGAFRTVPIDRFKNGSLGNRGIDSTVINIDQPWKRGELVKDSLSIRPTAMSYRALPDRAGVRPVGIRQLPAVIRSSPEFNPGSQGQFTRITNIQIPSHPSRIYSGRSIGTETSPGIDARANPRVIQTRQRDRAIPATQNPAGIGSEGQDRRGKTTYRWFGTSGNGRENSSARESSAPATRSDANPPAVRQITPGGRSEQVTPEQRQLLRTPPDTRPDREESHPSDAEPRSHTNGNRNSPPQAVGTPRVGSSPAYSPSKPTNASGGGEQKAPDRGSSGSGGNRK